MNRINRPQIVCPFLSFRKSIGGLLSMPIIQVSFLLEKTVESQCRGRLFFLNLYFIVLHSFTSILIRYPYSKNQTHTHVKEKRYPKRHVFSGVFKDFKNRFIHSRSRKVIEQNFFIMQNALQLSTNQLIVTKEEPHATVSRFAIGRELCLLMSSIFRSMPHLILIQGLAKDYGVLIKRLLSVSDEEEVARLQLAFLAKFSFWSKKELKILTEAAEGIRITYHFYEFSSIAELNQFLRLEQLKILTELLPLMATSEVPPGKGKEMTMNDFPDFSNDGDLKNASMN